MYKFDYIKNLNDKDHQKQTQKIYENFEKVYATRSTNKRELSLPYKTQHITKINNEQKKKEKSKGAEHEVHSKGNRNTFETYGKSLSYS